MFPLQRGESRRVDAGVDSPVFRLAHVSDLHLAEEAGVFGFHQSEGFRSLMGLFLRSVRKADLAPMMTSYDSRCFRALMDALTGTSRFTQNGYDGYLITGDIATTGMAGDMLAAGNALRRVQWTPGTETLDESTTPLPGEKVVLLPGNHDRYLGASMVPMSAHFEHGHNFGSNWSLDNAVHADQRSEVNHKVLTALDGTQLAVVTGDFSFLHPSPRFFKMLGGGKARQTTLDQMSALTSGYTSKAIAVTWAVHFPPFKKGVPRSLRLDRHEEVVRAAAKVGVETIFCGHTHEARPIVPVSYDDKITGIKVVCAGSACETVRPGFKDRSYFEVLLQVRGGKARLLGTPVEMIYSVWQERMQHAGHPGRGAEFCPAP